MIDDGRRRGKPGSALFPWRTVQGNVEFGLEELKAAPAERKARAARFIAMTGLTGFMKRVIPLKGIVDTSFVEEAARAVPEK